MASVGTGARASILEGTSLERLLDKLRGVVLEDAVREVNADFPRWRTWVSDEGHWYATRGSRVTPRVHGRPVPPTLNAGSEEELRLQLAEWAEPEMLAT